MKTNYLLILIIISILYSCEKDNKSNDLNRVLSEAPEVPKAMNCDLNGDSFNDIKVEYYWFTWDGVNCSGDGVSGTIKPFNGSSILLKRNEYALFNKLNDTINVNVSEPYYWEKYINTNLVAISNSSVNAYLWPDEWKVQSNMSLDSYYLGVKIDKGTSTQLGWIKIKINKSTGEIEIIDKKFVTSEYIVIGK